MPRTLVVSQPMFLPWIGMFEQVRLADVFVHYDDVQLPRGRSFTTRVQAKGQGGPFWLTAPVDRAASGALICEARFKDGALWREKHQRSLQRSYARAPHGEAMLALASQLYGVESDRVDEFDIHGLERLAEWLGLKTEFRRSSAMGVPGRSSERLLALCKATECERYVTGLGALAYLDHELFEASGVEVRYMDYQRIEYPQLHGEFTPYVSVLDAIANCGPGAAELVRSGTVHWRDASA